MAEKVVRLGIERDPDRMYWVARGAVWAIPRRSAGDPPAKKARVRKVELELDLDRYLYFLDADGDISRVERKRPKPRRRAKPRSKLAGVTPEQLFALLGKAEDAPALRELLAGLGRPRVSRYDELHHWCYPRHGLELMFKQGARGGRLVAVFLFARGHQGYSAYPGALPAGLTFRERRGDVEARLGQPDERNEYRAQGLEVTYRGRTRDRIGHLRLFRRRR